MKKRFQFADANIPYKRLFIAFVFCLTSTFAACSECSTPTQDAKSSKTPAVTTHEEAPQKTPDGTYRLAEDVRPKAGQKIAEYSYEMTVFSENPRSTALRLNAALSKILDDWPTRGIGIDSPLTLDIPGVQFTKVSDIIEQSGRLHVERKKLLTQAGSPSSVRITFRIQKESATKPSSKTPQPPETSRKNRDADAR